MKKTVRRKLVRWLQGPEDDMRNFAIASILVSSITAAADPAPTTQACLGNLDTLLACPAGAQRSGTECREREPKRGNADGEHWSGSKRQGPSVFLRDTKTVSFAARYKDHKKHGRTFRFDADGRLESWSDMANDDYHGLSVNCLPDGRVSHLAYFKAGKVVGVTLHWKRSDGSFSFAYDQAKKQSVTVSPAQMTRPDHLCQPKRCDLDAKPDLSGIPK